MLTPLFHYAFTRRCAFDLYAAVFIIILRQPPRHAAISYYDYFRAMPMLLYAFRHQWRA